MKFACVASAVLSMFSLSTPAFAAITTFQMSRPDRTIIHYSLDLPDASSEGLVVAIQGSGCAPGSTNANLAEVRAAFAEYTVLIVEKPGITPETTISDGTTDCPQAFFDSHTISARLDDFETIITNLRADTSQHTSPLVLIGGSEGGLVVSALAARVAADAAIILSGAPGMSFGDIVLSSVPPEGQSSVRAALETARANPQSSEIFAGSAYRFWADALDFKGIDHMIDDTSPYLLIQGGKDQPGSAEASRLVADIFAEQDLCNLTYWEFPALDHAMKDPNGNSHMPEILAAAAKWAEMPIGAC